MALRPLRFIGEPIKVQFIRPSLLEKEPDCPDCFVWQGVSYQVAETLSEWRDYRRRGRMSRNMSPRHLATASRRGSWGVGRHYFRVRTETGQIFDLYFDRAPKSTDERKGQWFLYRELRSTKG